MNSELLIRLQTVMGLNGSEARLYMALTDASEPPGVLAEKARIPRTKIYEVLASLVEKGLAQEEEVASLGLSSVRPAPRKVYKRLPPGKRLEALSNVLRKKLAELQSLGEEINSTLLKSGRAR